MWMNWPRRRSIQMASARCWFAFLCYLFLPGTNLPSGQKRAPTANQQLYLLAANPVDDGSRENYPATLYALTLKRLKLVRTVVPATDGVSSVLVSSNAIFMTYPLYRPTSLVAIVHKAEPLNVDDVAFNAPSQLAPNSNGYGLLLPIVQLVEPIPSQFEELLPIMNPSETKLLSVPLEANSEETRVRQGTWDEYSDLRREGDPGGSIPVQHVSAAVVGDNLTYPRVWGSPAIIDKLSADVRHAANRTANRSLLIVAASREYLLLRLSDFPHGEPFARPGYSADVFVHDRQKNQWKTIKVQGARSRLFGTWLATIGPALVLHNLEDDRTIRIGTGPGDIEVLDVTANVVLYRIYDTIFKARIAGTELVEKTVITKDNVIPQVHWVFWSKNAVTD